MEITIKLDDHDTNDKHVDKFLKLLERLIIILEDEPEGGDDG
tara:strand:+ start:453 stop:578 length:126 start_codon:yes stop_codon:yes gene_type:complete